jgi:phage baseplate assembly protein W
MTQSKLGTGFRFPLLTASQGFAWVSEETAIEQSIRSILFTEPGERIARPSFGVGLRRFLFASNTVELRAQIRAAIMDGLSRDEARIQVDDVDVSTESLSPSVLRIDIRYRVLDEPGTRNLVFPFYLEGVA